MRKYLFLLSSILSLALADCKAQSVPVYFFGENAWMPDSVGDSIPNGKLHSNWRNVANSAVKLVRVGGILPDKVGYSNYQYIKMIDSVRNLGMEPILQVSYFNGLYDSIIASALVYHVNVTKARNVKYWSIGNEPEKYQTNNTAALIAVYIKKFAIAMKKVDSTIRIIGPDLVRISIDPYDPTGDYQRTRDLLGGTSSILGIIPVGNGTASGKGYIDYFSYHMYNYDGTGSNVSDRQTLIERLTKAGKDSTRMGWIKRRLDSCNIALSRTSQPVKPMITEANICFQDVSSTNDGVGDLKASSFFAGPALVRDDDAWH